MPRPVFSTEAQSFRRYVRLFKITLKTINFIVRLAEWDQSISLDVGDGTGLQSWKASPGGPGITRGEAQQRADFQVDSLHAMLASTADNQLTLGTLGTKTVAQWAARGVFDGAMVDFYVYDFGDKASILWSRWFIQGAVSWSYDSASFTLESILSRFDRIAPRTVIQEACNNVLGDTSCTIILPNYQSTAVVLASPVPTRMVFAVSITSFGPGGPPPHPPVPNPLPADYIDLGSAQFTSSDLAPQKKLVLTQTAGLLITLADPLLGAPVAGDTLILTPGCDKSVATCVSKYGNLPNFRGFPYIPDPRVVFFQI